jgi:hypothetical protein
LVVPTKDEVAKRLAEIHYRVEPWMQRIHRIVGSPDVEARPDEPIKLLEANGSTIASGIVPLPFGPLPESGIHYSSIIVEVTPAEFRRIQAGKLPLPNGWTVGELIPRPTENGDG